MDRTEQIIEIVKAVSKKSTAPELDESLFDSGYLDSFALPDMLSELESKFRIKIPDSEVSTRKFDTVLRIDSYLARALSPRKG